MTTRNWDEYYLVKGTELNIKEGEIFLNMDDVQELLEYKDVFKKFLDKAVHSIQTKLWSCNMVGREWDAYVAIKTIGMMKKDLDSLEKVYKEAKF